MNSLKMVIRAGHNRTRKRFIKLYGDKYLDCGEDERKQALIDYALEKNISALKTDLEKYRINYDVWFRESLLHKNGEVTSAN